jgi:hypothetical protein
MRHSAWERTKSRPRWCWGWRNEARWPQILTQISCGMALSLYLNNVLQLIFKILDYKYFINDFHNVLQLIFKILDYKYFINDFHNATNNQSCLGQSFTKCISNLLLRFRNFQLFFTVLSLFLSLFTC